MKLKELKAKVDELIKQGKGDMEIIVSSDSEGNGFNELDEIITSLCYENELIHPDDAEEFEEDDLKEKLVIWSY